MGPFLGGPPLFGQTRGLQLFLRYGASFHPIIQGGDDGDPET